VPDSNLFQLKIKLLQQNLEMLLCIMLHW